MEGFIIAIDPVIASVGVVTLRWYGLMIAVGIAAGIFLALREARRRGLDEDATYTCALLGIVGGIVGARIFHIVDQLDGYIQNPDLILRIYEGGFAIWGGLVGGIAVGAVYAWRRGLPIAQLADVAAPALLLGQIIGRLGSIINGDAFGTLSDLPWALMYVQQESRVLDLGEFTHPYPIYEILWNTLLLGYIWQLRLKPLPSGALFLTHLLLYSIGRFVLTFVRQEQVWFLDLQEAQIVAVIAVAISAYLLVRLRGRAPTGASPTRLTPSGA